MIKKMGMSNKMHYKSKESHQFSYLKMEFGIERKGEDKHWYRKWAANHVKDWLPWPGCKSMWATWHKPEVSNIFHENTVRIQQNLIYLSCWGKGTNIINWTTTFEKNKKIKKIKEEQNISLQVQKNLINAVRDYSWGRRKRKGQYKAMEQGMLSFLFFLFPSCYSQFLSSFFFNFWSAKLQSIFFFGQKSYSQIFFFGRGGGFFWAGGGGFIAHSSL